MATRKTRNLNVEVLRIIAMLFIVACHGILHISWLLNVDHGFIFRPGWKSAFAYLVVQYGQVGVSIFFIISGYFLTIKKFNWTRIFKTWFQMFCYCMVLLISAALFAFLVKPQTGTYLFQGSNLITTLIWNFCPFFYGSYWFITAYIIMLLLLPFLNCIFDTIDEKHINSLIVILAVFSIWSLFFNRVGVWNNVAYAVLGYFIGGWIRKYSENHPHLLQTKYLLTSIVLSTVCMVVFNYLSAGGSSLVTFLGWQNQTKQGIQLLPMLIGSAAFLLINRIDMSSTPQLVQNTMFKLATSTFGVYLLHENMFLYRLIWPAMTRLFPTPHSIFSTILIFSLIIVVVYLSMSLLTLLLDTFIVHPLETIILNRRHYIQNTKVNPMEK